MHIVHVLTRLQRAGSEENILLTSAGQIAEGDEVTLVFGGDSTPDLATRLAPGARLVEVPAMQRELHPARDFAAWREMTRVFRELKPDVVHTHQSKAGIIGRYAARSAGVPCIVHGVHILPFLAVGPAKTWAYLKAERMAARTTHGYVHVSNGMLDACRAYDVGQSVPHIVVESGFDLDRFRKAEPPADRPEIVLDGALVMTMLAALEPRKRHLDLLEALAPSMRARDNLVLVFAGEGPLQQTIADRAESLGLADRVKILGYRSDPDRIIAMSDICLLASRQEGLPRSILQCLVGGKPVVTFELEGLSEVITPGRNAMVAGDNDWHAYRDAVERLVDQPALRQSIGEAAAQTDLSRWDWTDMGRRTTAFYRTLGRGV